MSNRTDVKYGDVKVFIKSSWIGHDVGHVKKGYWIQFRMPNNDHVHTGRSLGTVTYDGPPGDDSKIKNWVVAVCFSPAMDSVGERWIDPAWVIRSTPFPPARLLEFMMSDFSDREAVIKRVDDGIPTGFHHYYHDTVPAPDPRWTPARVYQKDENYDFGANEMPQKAQAAPE